jgi:hypothetical protein
VCPPEVELTNLDGDDEPSVYRANKIQCWLWDCWLDFCQAVPKGSIGVHVGDIVDGCNPRNGAVISYERADHVNIAVEVLSKFCERCSVVYFVFGTEWHEFTSGRDLIRVVNELSKRGFSVKLPRQEVWLEYDGRLIHFAHHRSISSAPSSKGTPLARAIGDMLFEAPKRSGMYPDVVVRAHAHDPGYLWIENGLSIGLPAWQFKTFFSWKKVPHVVSSVGGFFLDREDERWLVTPKMYRAASPKPFRHQRSKKS